MPRSKVRIELNSPGVREILKSPEMQELLRKKAQTIAGGGEVEVYVAETRAVAEARGNNQNNALLKRMR